MRPWELELDVVHIGMAMSICRYSQSEMHGKTLKNRKKQVETT